MRNDQRTNRYSSSRGGGRETRDWRDTQAEGWDGDESNMKMNRRQEFNSQPRERGQREQNYYESGFSGPSQPFGARNTQTSWSDRGNRPTGEFAGKGPKGYTRS